MGEQESASGSSGKIAEAGLRGWVVALALALVLFLIAYVGFVLVPDRLVTRTFEGLVPRTRDALVLLWVAAFFVFMCWLFVRVQRPLRGVGRAIRR